jgi:AcrR family transcriptional regulator
VKDGVHRVKDSVHRAGPGAAHPAAPPDARRALLDAAVALAQEGGVSAVGLREAARRAGLTHNAPYRHFQGREALVGAVAEEGFRSLMDACIAAQSRAGHDPLAQFQALGVAYLTFALHHRGHFRVMFSEEGARDVGVRSAEAAVFSLAVSVFAAAQRQGKAAPGDPQELAMLAWGSVHGMATLVQSGLVGWVGLQLGDEEKMARRLTHRLFEGLGPKGAPRR